MFVRALIVVAVGLVLWAVLVRPSDAAGPEQRYQVRPGDTLWSIAARTYADPREGVLELQQRNGLRGATIVPGQVLVVP